MVKNERWRYGESDLVEKLPDGEAMRSVLLKMSLLAFLPILATCGPEEPTSVPVVTPTLTPTATTVQVDDTPTATAEEATATAVENTPTEPKATQAAEGCAAVPVCDGDPNCHFLTDSVDGLEVSCSNETGSWMIRVVATGLPDHAYSTANGTVAQDYDLQFPLEPAIDLNGDQVSCPDTGGPDVSGMQGILINGVAIHRSLTPQLNDPVNPPEGEDEQPIDPCDGHGTDFGQYHLHTLPVCLYGSFFEGEQTYGANAKVSDTSWDLGLWPAPSGIIGFALEGHPIYGPFADASENRHEGLDACNGRLSDDQESYAYYVTENTFPYMLGCPGPGKAMEDTTAEDWACTGAPPDFE